MAAMVEPAQRRALDALERHGAFLQEMLEGLRCGRSKAESVDKLIRRGFRLGPERFARKLELTLDSRVERRRGVATSRSTPRRS